MKKFLLDLKANTNRENILYVFPALLTSPGFCAVLIYRMSVFFSGKGALLKVFSLIFWRFNILLFSCHLHPRSRVGPGLALPHPTGVVFGEGVVLGRLVTVYQGVTLGTSGGMPTKYPTVCDQVIIYPNSVIVGEVTINSGAVIGANSFVNRDVAANSTVAGVPARPLL